MNGGLFMTTVYDFTAKTAAGEEVSLDQYKGTVLLIVNTASKCGFTPQFEGLQNLYDNYQDKGLVILGFPCDQFNNQEFDKIEETIKLCQTNYGVTFPMFEKVDVHGDNAHPLFAHLQEQKGGVLTKKIKWNFTKFLVDREGNVIDRYAPMTKPESIEKDIVLALESK